MEGYEPSRGVPQKIRMERSEEMFAERNKLLKAYIAHGMRASTMLKLIEPMETMSEDEKEVFAKELRMKLEQGEIDF